VPRRLRVMTVTLLAHCSSTNAPSGSGVPRSQSLSMRSMRGGFIFRIWRPSAMAQGRNSHCARTWLQGHDILSCSDERKASVQVSVQLVVCPSVCPACCLSKCLSSLLSVQVFCLYCSIKRSKLSKQEQNFIYPKTDLQTGLLSKQVYILIFWEFTLRHGHGHGHGLFILATYYEGKWTTHPSCGHGSPWHRTHTYRRVTFW
jgi:hypothetical protein